MRPFYANRFPARIPDIGRARFRCLVTRGHVPKAAVLFKVRQTHKLPTSGRFFTRVQVPWTTLFSGVPKALQVAVGRGVLTYRLVPWTAPVVCVLKALELSIGSRQHAYGSRPWEPVTFGELPVTYSIIEYSKKKNKV
ncbi:unnamed protein product [Macrosiphum euphorbiae]|uniref:Uncharacterized protein n=1 Tax=Macrosiphum euphorbiae TaxID=13131 RepID=A0AAV0WAV2_9HEMI|nr:unnamed protein product [Macrosiphum euphorbiae]